MNDIIPQGAGGRFLVLPPLPPNYRWYRSSYLYDVYKIYWVTRIFRIDKRRFWFDRYVTVKLMEIESYTEPQARILAWAEGAAREVWAEYRLDS